MLRIRIHDDGRKTTEPALDLEIRVLDAIPAPTSISTLPGVPRVTDDAQLDGNGTLAVCVQRHHDDAYHQAFIAPLLDAQGQLRVTETTTVLQVKQSVAKAMGVSPLDVCLALGTDRLGKDKDHEGFALVWQALKQPPLSIGAYSRVIRVEERQALNRFAFLTQPLRFTTVHPTDKLADLQQRVRHVMGLPSAATVSVFVVRRPWTDAFRYVYPAISRSHWASLQVDISNPAP